MLVEVFRGTLVESRHAGAIAVADADGGLLFAFGDVERPVFPRSAVKAMQAMPLVESGAADAFGLGDDELAVACASHSGELAHVEAVRSLLAKAGLDESYLACGAHWPISEEASRELIRVGRRPQAIHNNCSGKHAGMLAACSPSRLRSARLCAARPSAAESDRENHFRDLRNCVGPEPHGDRRLLGADLGRAASRTRARLRAARHRGGAYG